MSVEIKSVEVPASVPFVAAAATGSRDVPALRAERDKRVVTRLEVAIEKGTAMQRGEHSAWQQRRAGARDDVRVAHLALAFALFVRSAQQGRERVPRGAVYANLEAKTHEGKVERNALAGRVSRVLSPEASFPVSRALADEVLDWMKS